MDVLRPSGRSGRIFTPRFRHSSQAAVLTLLLAGCTAEDPIVVETVPKDPAPRSLADEMPAASDRMFAAILPHGETAWFFKMTGPDAAVAAKKADFLKLIQSVRFEGDHPRWTLPEGWKEGAGNAMRLATLQVPGTPPLELAVSSLAYSADDPTGFLLMNVNRWRDQMELPHITADRLHSGGTVDDETLALKLDDGTKATLVNFKGRFSSGGMTPPFAAGGTSSPPVTTQPEAPISESPLQFETPSGWKHVGGDGISVATFLVGDPPVKVTVTPLSASNDLVSNVNRWREQVGLPKLEPAALEGTIETISLGDGKDGKYVVLSGPDDVERRQAILGVMAVRGDTAWFVKLSGEAEPALRERANFESFVKGLRFPAAGG